MDREATAIWEGGFEDGKGVISSQSNNLDKVLYTKVSRFETGRGTNPEELLAAAHAACFNMALSFELGKRGMKPSQLETKATISLERVGDGFSITRSRLVVVGYVPGAEKGEFEAAVKAAEKGCPVSKLYKTEITVSPTLINYAPGVSGNY